MDYRAHYLRLMERADDRELSGYFERHHVVPRCLDKSSTKTVRLTPEEHYVAHQLLVKMYPGNRKLVHAAFRMTHGHENYAARRNKAYGWLRRRYAKAVSAMWKGKKCPPECLCWKHSATLAAKMSESRKGKPGHPHSMETRLHLSLVRKGKPGKPHSKEERARRSASLKGKPWSKARRLATPVKEPVRKMTRSEARYAYWAKKKAEDALLSPELKARKEIMRLEKQIADLQAAQEKEEAS